MTHDERLIPLLTDWLEGQPSSAPDRLLNSVLTDLQSAPQNARWKTALRSFPMFTSNGARYFAVAAAGVLAVVIGFGLWAGRPGGVGAPTSSPTQPPTLAPTATPEPTPSRTPEPTLAPTSPEAGVFRSLFYGYSIDMPAEWEALRATALWPDDGVVNGTNSQWFDVFHVPAEDDTLGFLAIAAQPIPDGMTTDEWMARYAERQAALDFACKGPVDAWVDGTVGALTYRRIDVTCEGRMPNGEEVTGRRSADLIFVNHGDGYVVTGHPDLIAPLLESIQFEP